MPRGSPRPKGPKKPVFCVFPPLGVRSAKTQNVKNLRNFEEKLLGRADFSSKSAPISGKLCFLRFWSRISLSAKGYPRPKGPRKPVICDFPPLGSGQPKTQNVKKLHNFEEKFLGRTVLPKVPLAPGNCVFMFLTRARNFSRCPKTAQNGPKTQ